MSIETEFEKSIHSPHDAGIKKILQKKKLAKSFFQTYFPKEIVKHIDFNRLELSNKSYVDEKLKEKHSDIVYKTTFKGMDTFLFILFEHQSTSDSMMVFRLLCYMVNIWKEYLDQNPDSKCLPVIFPAVLYNGKTRWNAEQTLGGLIKGHDVFSEYMPDFTYKVYDLGEYPDEMLMLGSKALSAMLHLFKHMSDEDVYEHLLKAMQIISEIKDQKTMLEILELALRYTYHARNEDEETVKKYIEKGIEYFDDIKAREVAMTVAEQIRQKALTEGKTRTGGIILKQIKKRFGIISPLLEQKLMNSDFDMLDKFGESIFDFKNLNDAEIWWETHGTEH
ncbi:Rpn family recombination-promoting nuclease/putative transposase [Desulfobacterales bacterium HSG17]|nr:Rpn family recombination-promoting nuclease/putative transposase [Desulfobacterales bacterium HSG17]